MNSNGQDSREIEAAGNGAVIAGTSPPRDSRILVEPDGKSVRYSWMNESAEGKGFYWGLAGLFALVSLWGVISLFAATSTEPARSTLPGFALWVVFAGWCFLQVRLLVRRRPEKVEIGPIAFNHYSGSPPLVPPYRLESSHYARVLLWRFRKPVAANKSSIGAFYKDPAGPISYDYKGKSYLVGYTLGAEDREWLYKTLTEWQAG